MLITLFIGFVLGFIFFAAINNVSEQLKKSNAINEINKQFKSLLDSITKSKFKTRLNNAVVIGAKMENYGKVDIIYYLDKKDIAVFKDNKCIMTSNLVKKELIDSITSNIDIKHGRNINDVVDLFGIIISRADLEKTLNINFEDLKNSGIIDDNGSTEDIDDNLNIDDILDKINKVGLKNLTPRELNFLNKSSKK